MKVVESSIGKALLFNNANEKTTSQLSTNLTSQLPPDSFFITEEQSNKGNSLLRHLIYLKKTFLIEKVREQAKLSYWKDDQLSKMLPAFRWIPTAEETFIHSKGNQRIANTRPTILWKKLFDEDRCNSSETLEMIDHEINVRWLWKSME